MDKLLYVMLLKEGGRTDHEGSEEVVIQHVAHIKNLDDKGQLVLCGPLMDYPGVPGMIIFRAESYEAAEAVCKVEPLVVAGYATYKLVTLQPGNRENNYLL